MNGGIHCIDFVSWIMIWWQKYSSKRDNNNFDISLSFYSFKLSVWRLICIYKVFKAIINCVSKNEVRIRLQTSTYSTLSRPLFSKNHDTCDCIFLYATDLCICLCTVCCVLSKWVYKVQIQLISNHLEVECTLISNIQSIETVFPFLFFFRFILSILFVCVSSSSNDYEHSWTTTTKIEEMKWKKRFPSFLLIASLSLPLLLLLLLLLFARCSHFYLHKYSSFNLGSLIRALDEKDALISIQMWIHVICIFSEHWERNFLYVISPHLNGWMMFCYRCCCCYS